MDVSATLKTAWDAVQTADLPEQIQSAAFTEAVRMLAGTTDKTGAADDGQQATRTTTGGTAQPSGATPTESLDEFDLLTRVEKGTGVPPVDLSQLIHVDGDTVKISVGAHVLGKTSSAQTRALARLITVTRTFGVPENDTSLELIRTEANHLRCYDGANFSRHIAGIPGYVVVGSGNAKRLRVKPAGASAFRAFVTDLVEAL